MTFYNHIENVRSKAIDLTNGWTWQGAIDRAAIFDNLDAARREYMRLSDENEKLRKLAKDLHDLARNVLPERKSDYITICSVESCIDYYSKTMPSIEKRMNELGVE